MSFNFINILNLIIVVLLLIPNVINLIKKNTISYKSNHAIINVFEQIGRYGSIILMILPLGIGEFGFGSDVIVIYLFGTAILIIAYLFTWILFSKKQTTTTSVMLSVLPSLTFIICGLTLNHYLLVVFSLIFGISHLIITLQNNH